MPSTAPYPPKQTPTAAEEHQCRNAESTNTQRERPTCTHKSDSPVISPTLSGKVPLRLVEYKTLPAPRHNQHAATHPRFYPCHPQPPIHPKYNHCLQRNINAEMQKPQTRTEKGQHALTTLTAQSSRRHSPARCRSGSSSPSPCPRPDTISMQPHIHASTHAIRSHIPPKYTHRCRGTSMQKPQTRRDIGQHALTMMTA